MPKAQAASVNLDHYVPAYLTWIANKLSGGASQHYLNAFGVGIETWRCLVLLAAEPTVSAQQISKVIGMDKSSVSRCFKSMQEQKLITLTLSDTDGRIRVHDDPGTAETAETAETALSATEMPIPYYLYQRSLSILGGSIEIQKDIVARTILS